MSRLTCEDRIIRDSRGVIDYHFYEDRARTMRSSEIAAFVKKLFAEKNFSHRSK